MNNRYDRQVRFDGIGEQGQKKILMKHVGIIGAGALGTHVAETLIRAGIGYLSIIDRDYVEYSNLQRQCLYTERDAGEVLPKAVAAKKHLEQINHNGHVNAIVGELSGKLFSDKFSTCDVIVDATDNFETRLLLNDLAIKYKIPWIFGGCLGSKGLTYTIIPDETPCLSCLMNHMPFSNDSCDLSGIIAPIVEWVATQQVVEVFKLLVEDHTALRGTLLYEDMWTNEHISMNVQTLKNPLCLSCGRHRTHPYLSESKKRYRTSVLCGRDTVHIRPEENMKLDMSYMKQMLMKDELPCVDNGFLLHTCIDGHRLILFQDGRALIHNTSDMKWAMKLYKEVIRKGRTCLTE
ncbi:ThiF family adenylyltransferase [Terrilactibacillus laevilacticus]|uniref:ThiF family adenylyltransferase n=1 Tax=Terrilactibacillus laevilacticus TaxID=1380157 RepID=UPI0011477800|nr:ThiF family adenylyltransferase [Terrilactibacillus laevilacticus]